MNSTNIFYCSILIIMMLTTILLGIKVSRDSSFWQERGNVRFSAVIDSPSASNIENCREAARTKFNSADVVIDISENGDCFAAPMIQIPYWRLATSSTTQ